MALLEFPVRAIRRESDGGGDPPDNADMENRVTTLETVIPTLATKSDVGMLRADLAATEGRLMAVLERGINETQRWMIATVIGLFIGFGGLFLAMSNALKPGPAAAPVATQPVVVVLPAAPAASR